MADYNPYSPPTDQAATADFAECEYEVSQPLLIEAAAEEMRARRGELGRLPKIGFLLALAAGGGFKLASWQNHIPFLSENVVNLIFFGLILAGAVVLMMDWRRREKRFRAEAQLELANLQARMPIMNAGIWRLHIDPGLISLTTAAGGLAWKPNNLRSLTFEFNYSSFQPAILLRTPELLIPIPKAALGAVNYQCVSAAIHACVSQEFIPRRIF